jgi:MFS family permease
LTRRRCWQQFLGARMGVGVGEALLSPSAYSLIADSFPRERRATAISVYSMGIYVGAGLRSSRPDSPNGCSKTTW